MHETYETVIWFVTNKVPFPLLYTDHLEQFSRISIIHMFKGLAILYEISFYRIYKKVKFYVSGER